MGPGIRGLARSRAAGPAGDAQVYSPGWRALLPGSGE